MEKIVRSRGKEVKASVPPLLVTNGPSCRTVNKQRNFNFEHLPPCRHSRSDDRSKGTPSLPPSQVEASREPPDPCSNHELTASREIEAPAGVSDRTKIVTSRLVPIHSMNYLEDPSSLLPRWSDQKTREHHLQVGMTKRTLLPSPGKRYGFPSCSTPSSNVVVHQPSCSSSLAATSSHVRKRQ
jgi:hypothetical protein